MGQNGLYKPNMKLYLNDYDQNGKLEAIYTYSIDKKDFPIHDRDELTKQLPDFEKETTFTYEDYANQSIKDIFNETQISSSQVLEIKETRSLLFMSDSSFHILRYFYQRKYSILVSMLLTFLRATQDGLNDLILVEINI